MKNFWLDRKEDEIQTIWGEVPSIKIEWGEVPQVSCTVFVSCPDNKAFPDDLEAFIVAEEDWGFDL